MANKLEVASPFRKFMVPQTYFNPVQTDVKIAQEPFRGIQQLKLLQ